MSEGLFISKEIGENIIVTSLWRFLNNLKFINFNKANRFTSEMAKSLNIKTPSLKLPVNSLSGGNQQRVVVAKWISTDPKVFILDGPTVGIDVASKRDIHMIMRDLAKKGVAMIVISDEIPEIMQNCNRILVMRKGRLPKEFDVEHTTEQELNDLIVMAEEPA